MAKTKLIQDHALLAKRIYSMVSYLYSLSKPTDEQKKARDELNVLAHEHERKAAFQEKFIMQRR